MENVVLKANRYRIVDNSAFEMPLPLKFVVWKSEAPICEYLISEDEQITYNIITKYKELMITTIHRRLDIADIYYLFSCRVFQDRTPFTYPILGRMGIEKYNVYNILRRTHGITPYDDYWIRFDGEELDFDQALAEFDKYLIEPEAQPVPIVSYPSGAETRPGRPARPQRSAEVDSILNQHKVDVSNIVQEASKPASIAPDVSYEPEREIENNKMSEDEIEALLRSAGISDEHPAPDAVPEPQVEPSTRSQEPSGGTMSQDDIEKLLDSAFGDDSAESMPEIVEDNAPEKPADDTPSGGKMSQEDNEKLLAANAPEAPAEPEKPAETESPASGGKMSQEDIEKLLAANSPTEPTAPSAPAEPEKPAETESPASGGKMSQADIEALLNSMQEEANK